MRIHGNQMPPDVGLYAAAAAEKAAAAERAAQVREKLLRGARRPEDDADRAVVSTTGQEPDSGQGEEKEQAPAPKKKQLATDEESGEPVSMWA
jgi:hypothetical protein